MDTAQPLEEIDPEVEAIRVVFGALKDLEPAAQNRVLEYVIKRLALKSNVRPEPPAQPIDLDVAPEPEPEPDEPEPDDEPDEDDDDGLEGINAVARKWMRRSGLSAAQLQDLFSLGIDDIDLVATSVPGGNNKERLRSVVLLKAIASYLSSGAPRVDHNKVKEAAKHYEADPGKNMATYMKGMAAEVSGSAASGYTLTSRGITAATQLVKQMLAPAQAN